MYRLLFIFLTFFVIFPLIYLGISWTFRSLERLFEEKEPSAKDALDEVADTQKALKNKQEELNKKSNEVKQELDILHTFINQGEDK